jgi:hypothetical protein
MTDHQSEPTPGECPAPAEPDTMRVSCVPRRAGRGEGRSRRWPWLFGLFLVALSTVAGLLQSSSMVWPGSPKACADVAVTVAVKPNCSASIDLLDYHVTAGHSHGPPTAVDAQRNAHQTYYVLAGDTPVLVHNQNDLFGCGTGIGPDDGPGSLLPAYPGHGPAAGIFDGGNGLVKLESGYDNPFTGPLPQTGNPGMNWNIRSHIEAQAATIMRNNGLTEATVYINRLPCPGRNGCAVNLPHMLPEGAQLTVYGPNGYREVFTGLPDR